MPQEMVVFVWFGFATTDKPNFSLQKCFLIRRYVNTCFFPNEIDIQNGFIQPPVSFLLHTQTPISSHPRKKFAFTASVSLSMIVLGSLFIHRIGGKGSDLLQREIRFVLLVNNGRQNSCTVIMR